MAQHGIQGRQALLPREPGVRAAVPETAAPLQRRKAKEYAPQQANRMDLLGLRQLVATQHRPRHLRHPHATAARRQLRRQIHSRRREQSGMSMGEVTVSIAQCNQGIPPGPSGHRLGSAISQAVERHEGDPHAKSFRIFQVRIKARNLHPELSRQRRQGDLLESHRVRQFSPGRDKPLSSQTCSHHKT